MNKTGQLALIGVIIALFIGVIFALAMLPSIATVIKPVHSKQVVTAEAIDLSTAFDSATPAEINSSYVFNVTNVYASDDWQYIESCPMSGVVYGNATTNYTLTTDYTFNLTYGGLAVENSTAAWFGGNTTFVYYTFCPDGYAAAPGTRSIAGLIVLFAALAVLGFAVYLGVRKTGLI